MRIFGMQYRAWLVALLALALAATFSLSSFAASGTGEPTGAVVTDSLLVPDAVTGTLTTRGPVIVNGNEAKTGATIADGSVIQTRTGGHAMIELGALGRVELDPITAITLCLMNHLDRTMPNSVQATLDKCGMGVTLILPAGVAGQVRILNISDVGVWHKDREVDVEVKKGEVLVKYGQGQQRTLKAGDHRQFDNATDVSATGDAVFKCLCDKDHYPALLWAGLAAAAIPVNGDVAPVVSPLAP